MDGISRERFRFIGTATLIYALIFTFCLYRNLDGIMTAFFAVATVAYIFYCAPRLQGYKNEDRMSGWVEPWKRESDGRADKEPDEQKERESDEQKEREPDGQESIESADAVFVPQSKRSGNETGSDAGKNAYVAAARSRYPYYAGIILLGISTFLTQDAFIITVNYLGMFLLVFGVLIRIFFSDKTWGFKKYILVMAEMALSPILYTLRPFQDYAAMRRAENSQKKNVVRYVIVGFVCALPVLLLVVALLSSADVIFSRVANYMFGDIWISPDSLGVVLMFAMVFVYVYGLCVTVTADNIDESVKDTNRLEPVIGITFTTLLTLVYLLYSGIQILQLFAGERMLPEGYTYSQYAREGFFELMFVAALNLLIVLLCIGIFRKHKVLDIVLTVMSACTYVMIVSSLVRMLLYIGEYNLTYLRILVLLALVMIAFVMAGLIIRIYRADFPLVHYVILAVGALWICFSFARPAGIIARYNLEKLQQTDATQEIISSSKTERTDKAPYYIRVQNELSYLCDLNADAAPALYEFGELMAADQYPEEISHFLYEYYFKRYAETEKMSLRSFNVSKYKAQKCAEQIAKTVAGEDM